MKKKDYISPEFKVIYLKAKYRILQDSQHEYKSQSTKNLRSTDDIGSGLEFD